LPNIHALAFSGYILLISIIIGGYMGSKLVVEERFKISKKNLSAIFSNSKYRLLSNIRTIRKKLTSI
jgi:hypothetical protein